MELKLREIKRTLEGLPASASISITSPEHLAGELFTHRGNGTYIRRGTPMVELTSFGSVDTERVSKAISASFGRRLSSAYFAREFDGVCVLIGGDHEAVAVLRHLGGGIYLDKFAVTPEAKGHGLAGTLWRAITERADRERKPLFWRSRCSNPINAWYAERADGMVRRDDWIVYWKGEPDLRNAALLADLAIAQPQDLSPVSSVLETTPELIDA